MNSQGKTENNVFARHSIFMSHKMVHKTEPLFAIILPEWAYIQCKLTKHLKKSTQKWDKVQKIDKKVREGGGTQLGVHMGAPPEHIMTDCAQRMLHSTRLTFSRDFRA